MRQIKLFAAMTITVLIIASVMNGQSSAADPTATPEPATSGTPAFDVGRVGLPVTYPTQYPTMESDNRLIVKEPVVKLSGEYTATISFETKIPVPGVVLHYGVFLPDQILPMPRYIEQTREHLDEPSTSHAVTLPMLSLAGSGDGRAGKDISAISTVAYRIELYNPTTGHSYFWDGRFAFKPGHVGPSIIEGPFVDQITPHSAIISWDTDVPVTSTLYAGTQSHPIGKEAATHFEVPVKGLTPGRTYAYRIEISSDQVTTSSRDYEFKTPIKNQPDFTFAVLSDSRGGKGGGDYDYIGVNYRVLNGLITDAYNQGADLILFPGDLISGYTTSPEDYDQQMRAWKHAVEPVGHYLPIYEMKGNHESLNLVYNDGSEYGLAYDKPGDVNSETRFAKHFVNPTNGPRPATDAQPTYDENVYYFDYGNSRFVALDNDYWISADAHTFGGNMEDYYLDDQFEWAKQVFEDAEADPTIQHIFLFAHEPPYPAGAEHWERDASRPETIERFKQIWIAFVASGKAVAGFFGHDHAYTRLPVTSALDEQYENPAWQIITAGAGAPMTPLSEELPWAKDFDPFTNQQHYLLITVDGPRVDLETYGLTGQLLDQIELTGQR